LSLILDALKKAQKQRENNTESMIDNELELNKKKLVSKRFVFLLVSISILFVVVLIITFGVFSNKSNNIRRVSNKPLFTPESIKSENVKKNSLKNNNLNKDFKNNKKLKGLENKSKKDIKGDISNKNIENKKVIKEVSKKKRIKKKKKEKLVKAKKVKKEDNKIIGKAQKFAVKKVKDNNLNKLNDFELLVSKGDELYNKKEFLLAVESYRKALKIEKRASLYIKIYQSLKSINNYVLAFSYLKEGVKYFPKSFAINKLLAINYIRNKEFDNAINSIEISLKKVKNDYLLYNYKGLCYFHKKNYEKAIENFKKSLELNPNSFENYYYIGLIHDNLKNYKKALISYKMFLRLNKKNLLKRHTEWVRKRIKLIENK